MDTLGELIDTNPLLAFADEVASEVMGTSNRRWALALLAFVAGGVLVAWLARKRATRATSEAQRIGT